MVGGPLAVTAAISSPLAAYFSVYSGFADFNAGKAAGMNRMMAKAEILDRRSAKRRRCWDSAQ